MKRYGALLQRNLKKKLARVQRSNVNPWTTFRLSVALLGRLKILRILDALSKLGIILAVSSFLMEISYRQIERETQAWQLITTPARGNGGKVEALQYLNSEVWYWPFKKKVDLGWVDLSAARNQGPVALSGIKLMHAEMPRANLEGADLMPLFRSDGSLEPTTIAYSNLSWSNLSYIAGVGVEFYGSSFGNANLRMSEFMGANFENTKLAGANLSSAKFEFASFENSDLNHAILAGANFEGANISNANFENTTGLKQNQLVHAWAWSDRPPRGLRSGLVLTHLCDPKFRAYYDQLVSFTERDNLVARDCAGVERAAEDD